ncbi:hypothetical protein BDR07DRAFT_1458902 [Suillus spraguei]|nr:hypothetical protein BDR07DRAFT_1458902 [Suillus spraguei]
MKLSLVFTVLASIVVFATAYPTQGETGIAKRSNVGKRDSEELDIDFTTYTERYRKRDEDSEELSVVDIEYQFNGKDYRKRDDGKRDSEEIGIIDTDYQFKDYRKRDEGKRTVLNYFDYDTDK